MFNFKKKHFTIIISILLMIPAMSFTQTSTGPAILVSGIVFEDSNKNGIKDTNEPGIPGAAISDQLNIVQTDKTGNYQISAQNSNRIIFISVPIGLQINRIILCCY